MPVVAIPLAPLLGALLAVAAIAKIARFRAWRAALDGYGLVPARGAVAVAVPALELALAAGLFAGLSWAAWGAAALLGAFTLVLGAELARGAAPPSCACLPWSRPPRPDDASFGTPRSSPSPSRPPRAQRPSSARAFWEASYADPLAGRRCARRAGPVALPPGRRAASAARAARRARGGGRGAAAGRADRPPGGPARPGDARRVHVRRLPRVPPDRPGPQGARARSRAGRRPRGRTRTRAGRSCTPPSTSRARPTRSTSTRRASSAPRAP